MLNIPPSQLSNPFYEGSVQRLFDVPDEPDFMVTQTTERGSVFDVGALFEIPGHDVNRAVFRHILYSKMGEAPIWQGVKHSIEQAENLDEEYRKELLIGPLEEFCAGGAQTHHIGMLDAETGEMVPGGLPKTPSAFNVVRKFKILKPERIDIFGASLFDYSKFPAEDGFVVPLEFIVRFGITSASSVFRKYQSMAPQAKKAFELELGVSKPLEAWQYLERPVSDFTTKYEPTDRMLTRQEAFISSSLNGLLFSAGTKMAVLGAWAVRHLLEGLGLSLWDIKWEFARDGSELIYVDTIDTDSFRGTLELDFEGHKFVNHYNKQAMRDYFYLLHPNWIEAIKEAKARGDSEGVAFTEILSSGQQDGSYAPTPAVEPDFIDIQRRKMTAICDFLLARIDSNDARNTLRETGLEELSFYRSAEKLQELASINAIS